MLFKVSPKAKAIINRGFTFQSDDGLHSKIFPTFLEFFPQALYKDGYDKINELSYFKCSPASRIKKIRDTAMELGTKYTFFKTWNSHVSNNDSLNCT